MKRLLLKIYFYLEGYCWKHMERGCIVCRQARQNRKQIKETKRRAARDVRLAYARDGFENE